MQGHLYRYPVFLHDNINGILNQFFPGIVQIFDKFTQSPLRIVHLMSRCIRLRIQFPLIGQRQPNAPVQVSQLSQTGGQYIILVFRYIKNRIIRQKGNSRPCPVRLTDNLHVSGRNTFVIFLSPDLPFPANLGNQSRGKRIDTRNTHSMQSTGNFIRILVELTTGMQYRHYHFQSRFILFGMSRRRYSPPIILDRNRIIFVDDYLNMVTISSQRFIDGIIHNLVN